MSSNDLKVISPVSLSVIANIPLLSDNSFADSKTKVCFAIFLRKDREKIGKDDSFF